MLFFTKNNRIKHDNIMKKQYKDYLKEKDTCRACRYCYLDYCELQYPKFYHSEENQCPRYDLKKGYKKAVKYIEKKNKKRDELNYDKNKID